MLLHRVHYWVLTDYRLGVSPFASIGLTVPFHAGWLGRLHVVQHLFLALCNPLLSAAIYAAGNRLHS